VGRRRQRDRSLATSRRMQGEGRRRQCKGSFSTLAGGEELGVVAEDCGGGAAGIAVLALSEAIALALTSM
jgi:hypothetical protein